MSSLSALVMRHAFRRDEEVAMLVRHSFGYQCLLKYVFVSSSLWLRNNEAEATKKQDASLPRREELKRLKKELCQKFAVADIRS